MQSLTASAEDEQCEVALCCDSVGELEDCVVGGYPYPSKVLYIGVAHTAQMLTDGCDVALLGPHEDETDGAEGGQG